MRRIRLAVACSGSVAALVTGPGAAAAGPAQSAACREGAGVTVVVDFGVAGGGTEVACALGDPESGLAALAAAGFTVTLTNGQPFVCQIDARPETSCTRFAPADAYWAYYQGEGGDWVYSGDGAASSDPGPGDVEGWAFGADAVPGIAPPVSAGAPVTTTTSRPATTAPPPPDAADRPTTTAPPAVTTTTTSQSTGTTSTVAPPSTSTTDAPDRATTTEVAGGTDARGDDGDGDDVAAGGAAVATETGSDDGPPIGLIAGTGLVAGLAVLAARQARRRPTEAGDDTGRP